MKKINICVFIVFLFFSIHIYAEEINIDGDTLNVDNLNFVQQQIVLDTIFIETQVDTSGVSVDTNLFTVHMIQTYYTDLLKLYFLKEEKKYYEEIVRDAETEMPIRYSEINYKLLSLPQKTILFDTTIKLVESEELLTKKIAVINNEPFIFILSSNSDEKKIEIYTVAFTLKKSIILSEDKDFFISKTGRYFFGTKLNEEDLFILDLRDFQTKKIKKEGDFLNIIAQNEKKLIIYNQVKPINFICYNLSGEKKWTQSFNAINNYTLSPNDSVFLVAEINNKYTLIDNSTGNILKSEIINIFPADVSFISDTIFVINSWFVDKKENKRYMDIGVYDITFKKLNRFKINIANDKSFRKIEFYIKDEKLFIYFDKKLECVYNVL